MRMKQQKTAWLKNEVKRFTPKRIFLLFSTVSTLPHVHKRSSRLNETYTESGQKNVMVI